MLSRKIVLPLLFPCLLAGCAAKRPITSADYYSSLAYQNREALGQSLFRSDQAILSSEEIEKILGGRIQIPRQAHLTVLRLGSSSEVLSWAFLSGVPMDGDLGLRAPGGGSKGSKQSTGRAHDRTPPAMRQATSG